MTLTFKFPFYALHRMTMKSSIFLVVLLMCLLTKVISLSTDKVRSLRGNQGLRNVKGGEIYTKDLQHEESQQRKRDLQKDDKKKDEADDDDDDDEDADGPPQELAVDVPTPVPTSPPITINTGLPTWGNLPLTYPPTLANTVTYAPTTLAPTTFAPTTLSPTTLRPTRNPTPSPTSMPSAPPTPVPEVATASPTTANPSPAPSSAPTEPVIPTESPSSNEIQIVCENQEGNAEGTTGNWVSPIARIETITYEYELVTPQDLQVSAVAQDTDELVTKLLALNLVECPVTNESEIRGLALGPLDHPLEGSCTALEVDDPEASQACSVMKGSVNVFLASWSSMTNFDLETRIWSLLWTAMNEREDVASKFLDETKGILNLRFVSPVDVANLPTVGTTEVVSNTTTAAPVEINITVTSVTEDNTTSTNVNDPPPFIGTGPISIETNSGQDTSRIVDPVTTNTKKSKGRIAFASILAGMLLTCCVIAFVYSRRNRRNAKDGRFSNLSLYESADTSILEILSPAASGNISTANSFATGSQVTPRIKKYAYDSSDSDSDGDDGKDKTDRQPVAGGNQYCQNGIFASKTRAPSGPPSPSTMSAPPLDSDSELEPPPSMSGFDNYGRKLYNIEPLDESYSSSDFDQSLYTTNDSYRTSDSSILLMTNNKNEDGLTTGLQSLIRSSWWPGLVTGDSSSSDQEIFADSSENDDIPASSKVELNQSMMITTPSKAMPQDMEEEPSTCDETSPISKAQGEEPSFRYFEPTTELSTDTAWQQQQQQGHRLTYSSTPVGFRSFKILGDDSSEPQREGRGASMSSSRITAILDGLSSGEEDFSPTKFSPSTSNSKLTNTKDTAMDEKKDKPSTKRLSPVSVNMLWGNEEVDEGLYTKEMLMQLEQLEQQQDGANKTPSQHQSYMSSVALWTATVDDHSASQEQDAIDNWKAGTARRFQQVVVSPRSFGVQSRSGGVEPRAVVDAWYDYSGE